MERSGNETLTREEVLKRFRLSKQKKQQRLKELESNLRADFKQRTGLEATTFTVW